MTTTTTKAAEAPAMPIADRLEHCAKFTGLDAVRELLIEAAVAVRKRDAVIRLLEGERAQATQAEVTDAEIDALCLSLTGFMTRKERDRAVARAILALRPVQVPMTHEAARGIFFDVVATHRSGWDNTIAVIRATEESHGITAQAKKETP